MDRAAFRRLQSSAGRDIDLTKVLRKVDVFASLNFAQLQQLRDEMQKRDYDDGELVFRQGDDPKKSHDAFFVISRGTAVVFTQDDGGPEREVMRLGETQYFGERALLHNEPRSASIRAVGPLQVTYISRHVFEEILGPLSTIIQEHTLKREAAAQAQKKKLEAYGLADASRSAFLIESTSNVLPCGALHLVRHVPTDTLYSFRQESKTAVSEALERVRVHRELEVLREINDAQARFPCSSLPSLLRAFQTDRSVHLLFQERAACELYELISDEPMGDNELRFAAACVAGALEVLHNDLQVLHRNLAPYNLTVLDTGYVQLMDHRLSKPDDGSRKTLCGLPAYVSPEMVRGQPQSASTDWWGFGNLLYELATQESPWGAHEDEMVIFKIISAHSVGNLILPEMISPRLGELMSSLLHPHARDRPGLAQVKAHPFFAECQWARLASGEMVSPLQEAAERIQATRAEEKAELPHEDSYGGTTEEDWLIGFDYMES